MNKLSWTLLLSLCLVPFVHAEEPDIIYVDGKPVYIKGLEPAEETKKSHTAEEEAARSSIPGDIYRGTVLGQNKNINRQNDTGDIYRGTIFGTTSPDYHGNILGEKPELAKTKYVYDTSLVRAIKTNDADRVRTLIYANVDVNERNYAGITPLTIAAEKGNMEIIKKLIEEGGASINTPSSYGVTPLIAAAAAGNREVVGYLLANGADPTAKDDLGKTALLHAMPANDKKLTESLVSQNNRAINLPDNTGNTPLIYAAKNGAEDNIKVLLKYKANPDYQNPTNGLSALASAAAAGQERAAQLLVNNGANINLQDKEGRTAVFYAAENGQISLLKQLIRLGADLQATDKNGQTVFMAAAQAQNIPALQFLAPKYFDINAADAHGKTALMYATAQGSDAVQWFIDKGADLNAQDEMGNTPLMHAIKNQNEKAALLLVKQDVDLSASNKTGQDAFTLAAAYMPESPVMKVLQVKKSTVLQGQLKARAAAQALANEEQAKLREQAQVVADEKLEEIRNLERQLEEEEAVVKQLQKEQLEQQRQAIRQQVEQEMTQQDEELAALQKQLDEAKAKKEAQIQETVNAKMQELDQQMAQ
ncbi:MAG: ankyrin repeat domain-containing protein [Elusimicrobiaceae bacterium]|nr:ankyrin repeat domain-containing protein [Elusimicrobiaceae bacterium]